MTRDFFLSFKMESQHQLGAKVFFERDKDQLKMKEIHSRMHFRLSFRV